MILPELTLAPTLSIPAAPPNAAAGPDDFFGAGELPEAEGSPIGRIG